MSLTPADVKAAAVVLGVSQAHVWAIVDVESAAAGFEGGKPVIRFEPHWFQKLTKGAFNKSHPRLSHSYAMRHNYAQPKTQRDRWANQFDVAFKLDPSAAIQATSFGLPQMMGFNYRLCGYTTPAAFFSGMCKSEGEQLLAMVRFIKAMGLADELNRNDWAGFAKVYNGPAYASAPGRANDYDFKLDQAFKRRTS